MKKLLVLALVVLAAASAYAQSTSSTWIDVTAAPYSANRTCSADASSAINSAISGAPAGSGVIFFPAGCYKIQTQLVDTNSSAYLTYLGEGNVEIQASSSTPPSNSIIQFGDNSHTVVLRKITNLFFNCNAKSIDGIDLDGLADSEFDDVTISYCRGTAHLRTTGNNTNNYSNIFVGGLIQADTAAANGIQLGVSNSSQHANAWSFVGTKVLGPGGGTSTGVGVDFEGASGSFYGGVVSEWGIGISVAVSNTYGGTPAQIGGFAISGSYIEDNGYYGIRVGTAGAVSDKAVGVAITGNYINCNNLTSTIGIELQQVSGFSITGNDIRQCTTNAIRGLSDASNQGADNGFVGANFIDGGQPVSLQGSNNTVTSSIVTKSSNYTLNGADSWVNVTGTTTITVPHAMTGQRWDVFNSGVATVTLACDSGNINGIASATLSSNLGVRVTTDGTNCFAH